MELSKKTTILFPPELHALLTHVARMRRTSLGELVREACEAQYGKSVREDRMAAAHELASLNLPVGPVEQMIAESVPDPEGLLP